jgi:hypothetical protein
VAAGRCEENGDYLIAMIGLAQSEGLWIRNIDIAAKCYSIGDVPESIKSPKDDRT